jgi:hypothetical protein
MNPIQNKIESEVSRFVQASQTIQQHIQDWQTIQRYLVTRHTDMRLTAAQQRKLELYDFIYAQLMSGKYSESEIVNILVNDPKRGLSRQTAYRELVATKELFATTLSINKVFEIKLMITWNKKQLIKADQAGDQKQYAAIEKNLQHWLEMLPQEEEASEMFTPHQNVIDFDPELIQAPDVDLRELADRINSRRKNKINLEVIEEMLVIEEKRNGKTQDPL